MSICFRFYIFILSALFSTLSHAQNVLISTSNNPNEPCIKMDVKNPNRLIAATNLNNYYISIDTGQTWTQHSQTSSFGVWGDPVIDVDTSGNFYYFHLSNPASGNWIDRIVCQKSTNIGASWSNGSFTGLNGTKAQDKHWSIVDRSNNNIYLTWTQFDDYGSSNPSDSSLILFSKSIDGGLSWTPPLRLNELAGDCIDSDNTVEGATPAIGPNGEVYVAWTGPEGLVFDRSLDGGITWLQDDILIDQFAGDWDYNIPGISRCNGLPVLKCDLSGGPNHGTIYVNWSDQRNGINNTDIFLSKSTDGGNTWSPAKKVNTDNTGRHQFLTWMDVDQTNGYLHFVFYDRRNYSNNQTDVFLAYSKDGGTTFKNEIVSESSFTPSSGIFFGDYNNIVAHNNVIRPIWTRLQGGSLSIWTDVTPRDFSNDTILITDTITIIDTIFVNDTTVIYDTTVVYDTIYTNVNHLDDSIEFNHYPNPARETTYVSFKLHEKAQISLKLYNMAGQEVRTLIDNEERGYGKYIIPIDLQTSQLPPGQYYCKLKVNESFKTLSIIVVD